MGKGREHGYGGERKTQVGKNVTGSRVSVQPERRSSLVDRNIADNVFLNQ